MSQEIISLTGITKHYKVGAHIVKALQNINLKIYKNEYVALMGPPVQGNRP